jgi:hypothetical protein
VHFRINGLSRFVLGTSLALSANTPLQAGRASGFVRKPPEELAPVPRLVSAGERGKLVIQSHPQYAVSTGIAPLIFLLPIALFVLFALLAVIIAWST